MVGDSASDISVSYYVGSTFVDVINTSLYTLFINPPAIGQIWGIGGTVIYPLTGSPIANGTSLLIERTLPLTQTISIANQGGFSPEVIEEALDTLCMQIQQINNSVSAGTNISATSIISALGYTLMNGANNLSEIVSASAARTNLALGTMAIQNASAVAVTGGTIDGVAITNSSYTGGTIDNVIIGGSTALAGTFTTLNANDTTIDGTFTQSGGNATFDLSSGNHNFTVDNSSGSGAIELDAGSGGFSVTANGRAQIISGNAQPLNLFSDSGSVVIPAAGGLNVGSGQFVLDSSGNISASKSISFTTASSGITLKRGANGRVGTVVLTGTTAVSVSNTIITTSDLVSFSLNTVGGTVGAIPVVKTITPLSGFTVAGTVSDTSTYNYTIIKNTI